MGGSVDYDENSNILDGGDLSFGEDPGEEAEYFGLNYSC